MWWWWWWWCCQGYTDLGDFCHQRGDLENALKNYVRTRDYCHVTRHNIDMCLNVIKVLSCSCSSQHHEPHALPAWPLRCLPPTCCP